MALETLIISVQGLSFLKVISTAAGYGWIRVQMPMEMPPPTSKEFVPGSVACGLHPAADKLILMRKFQKHSETIV